MQRAALATTVVRVARVASLVLLSLAACDDDKAPGADARQPGPSTLATVGGKVIDAADVVYRIEEFTPDKRRRLRDTPDAQKQLLEKMIEEELIVAVAQRRGLDQSPRFQRMVRHYLVTMIKEDVYKMVTMDKITDAEVRAYYENHPREFSTKARLRARQILLPSADAAKALLPKASAASDKAFAALARRHSIDQATRERGGDLGYLTQPTARVPTQLFGLIASLGKPGATGGPVRSDRGWHIVRLSERHPAERRPLEQVKLQAKVAAFRKKRAAVYRRFIDELEAATPVTRFPERIEQIRALLPAS